jgi:hypothetical protein
LLVRFPQAAVSAAFAPVEERVEILATVDHEHRKAVTQATNAGAGVRRSRWSARDYCRLDVCKTSLRHDRVVKAHRYAAGGIADYWIVNLAERQLEILRKPDPDPSRAGRFRYARVTLVPADGLAAPLAKPEARTPVPD